MATMISPAFSEIVLDISNLSSISVIVTGKTTFHDGREFYMSIPREAGFNIVHKNSFDVLWIFEEVVHSEANFPGTWKYSSNTRSEHRFNRLIAHFKVQIRAK